MQMLEPEGLVKKSGSVLAHQILVLSADWVARMNLELKALSLGVWRLEYDWAFLHAKTSVQFQGARKRICTQQMIGIYKHVMKKSNFQ
jgi:hypothetical protein